MNQDRQPKLAELAEIQKGYVSMIELRRVGPPSKKVVAAIEKALEVTDGYLRKLADWEQTPEPVRKQAEGWADQAALGQELADWLKENTGKKAGGTNPEVIPPSCSAYWLSEQKRTSSPSRFPSE